MRMRLRLLDTIVELHTRDDTAARLLEVLWETMATDEPGEPARTYELARDPRHGWIATAGGEIEAIHDSLWGVTDALRFRMLELCEENLERFVTLHAAAVARGEDLVVLAGESGAGKTTLTLALLDAGWTYLSDDLAPVSVDTTFVHPFPKPLGVKNPAVWRRVRTAFPDELRSPAPSGSFLVPPSRWPVATTPLPVRLLLFPRFTAGAALDTEPLSPARAAASATAYLRRLDPTTLGLVKRVCAAAECARIEYGSTADALGAVDAILGGASR